MSQEMGERRPRGVRKHTRRLLEEVRHDPDFEHRVLPLLRQRVPDFDKAYGTHINVLQDIFVARKEKQETGNTDKLDALIRDYESPDGVKYDPKHPHILLDLKQATDVIVGIFKRR